MPFETQVARSLNTKYNKTIRSKVVSTIKEYKMIQSGDKIAVCVSGGKDSMLLCKIMQDLQSHGKTPFDLCFISMNPGYNKENLTLLTDNAQKLGIPLEIFETNVFQVAENHAKNPCFLCAKMRRGWLYTKAQEMGCNKIALGHHFDDVVETILMAMIYGGQVQTMMPRLKADNFDNMELIRPLYNVHECDIIEWTNEHQLKFLDCACSVTQKKSSDDVSKRAQIKELIANLCTQNGQIKQNILNSVKNIDLTRVIGYRIDGNKHNFLDKLEDKI